VRSINRGAFWDFVFDKLGLRWTASLNVLLMGLMDEFENFEVILYTDISSLVN
jgi:hypothetical protein